MRQSIRHPSGAVLDLAQQVTPLRCIAGTAMCIYPFNTVFSSPAAAPAASSAAACGMGFGSAAVAMPPPFVADDGYLTSRGSKDTCVLVTEDLVFHAPTSVGSSKNSRKEKSLGSMCQRFLCIYLLGRTSLTLDEAAAVLAGPEVVPPSVMRTKIRRLYDIANVLCTLRLLEKGTSGKRVLFVWRGPTRMVYEPMARSVELLLFVCFRLPPPPLALRLSMSSKARSAVSVLETCGIRRHRMLFVVSFCPYTANAHKRRHSEPSLRH